MTRLLTLSFGVNDFPYSAAYQPPPKKPTSAKGKRAAAKGYAAGMTTGDVAEILEAKYGVMEFFAVRYRPFILSSIDASIKGAIKNMLLGAGPSSPQLQAMSEIETKFKQMLSQQEMDGQVNGVPTKASLLGVSHRFKRPYVKRPPRPSFIDTGLYQSSFKAGIT